MVKAAGTRMRSICESVSRPGAAEDVDAGDVFFRYRAGTVGEGARLICRRTDDANAVVRTPYFASREK